MAGAGDDGMGLHDSGDQDRLVAYVSDEHFAAVAGVALEFDDGAGSLTTAASTASGAVYACLSPGTYGVTLARDGYGAKRSRVEVREGEAHHFRLLSERVTGYVWPKWVRSGETGSVRVHSSEAYRLTLVRHGVLAEQTALLGWFDEHGPRATAQVTPDGDYSQTGVDWTEHARIAAPPRSGLYTVQIETESGARFSCPWVVAPAEPTSRVAVLASTNTWCAYNNFGGRSNYINATRLPDVPTVFARSDLARYVDGTVSEHHAPDGSYRPLSFDRPEPLNQIGHADSPREPIRGRQQCHLAAAEWRLLSWLEAEGFPHDIYAEAQLHDGGIDLDSYSVLVLSTHPEYWSARMYDRVLDWVVNRGGKLMYLGGNGLDCEVEFVDRATLRFHTQDPEPHGPHENRMHRSHAATSALLGVVFTEAGAQSSAPFRVLDASHWAFEGTGMLTGDVFGTRSLHERCPGGASGHETDKRTPRSPDETVVIAKGTNVDDGGAEVVHIPLSSGGEVFSVGSITWVSSILVDDGVAAVTRNVLTRFLGG